MSTPKIKFDLQIKYGSEYGPEEERAILEVLRQGAPTSGEACIQFEHDFAAYCKKREGATTIRTLQQLSLVRGDDGIITATVRADAFCHNMVRSLIGALLFVGDGHRGPEWPGKVPAAGVRDFGYPLLIRWPRGTRRRGRGERCRERCALSPCPQACPSRTSCWPSRSASH